MSGRPALSSDPVMSQSSCVMRPAPRVSLQANDTEVLDLCVCVRERERRSSACQCKWHLICWVMEMHWHSLVCLAHSYGFSILYSISTGCWACVKEMARPFVFKVIVHPKRKNILWFTQTPVILNLYFIFWRIFPFICNLTAYVKGIRCFFVCFLNLSFLGREAFLELWLIQLLWPFILWKERLLRMEELLSVSSLAVSTLGGVSVCPL